MKKRLLLFAILFFGLCGCDKDNGEDVDPPGIGHFVWVNASDVARRAYFENDDRIYCSSTIT